MPRPAAWHMEHRAVRGPTLCNSDPNNDACYWAVDTEAQWTDMLTLQNSAVPTPVTTSHSISCHSADRQPRQGVARGTQVDIWSVHHYEAANRSTSCDGSSAHSCRDCFFDPADCTDSTQSVSSLFLWPLTRQSLCEEIHPLELHRIGLCVFPLVLTP